MKNKILSILLIYLTLPCTYAFSEEKILFSIDLIRHGDRTPITEIPNYPHQWQEGLGELTKTGINQEIQLGKKLRQKYVDQLHLLPDQYNPASIYIRSTHIKRAIMSADSCLFGLYPSNKRTLLNQKITPEIIPASQDNLLMVKPSKNIFSLGKLFYITQKSWILKTYKIKDKLTNWSKQTGIKLNNFKQLASLGDNLYIRQLHHIPLPPGINNTDAKEIISLSKWALINYFKLKEVTYPTGHEFIKTANNYFYQTIQTKSPLKYVLYSAHDSSIMSVMTTLGVPLNDIPPYAANLNFSLFQNKDKYYVRVSYNDKLVSVPGCENDYCTLAQFKKIAP
ncbi:major acid phosphatase Map (histidine-acid phosphatase) [Legionella busanensis]|uniref:Major acid phosphatase Map (Histidine-acid phosphatase) n=1 Tax=Legionella busanensis TaxID=190655 RepID=A0A378JNV0_9GAMM|nr:histidine phosphatase family protein [Legionella busanensis]STX52358.1 major acid phosphatase Map (histidine-acid phosphatase) [Legionella busanensis]